MKSLFVTSSLSLLFLFSAPVVMAASYPNTCPAEAQAIVSAVGGCSAISCSQYAAICGKCCPSANKTTPSTSAASPALPSHQKQSAAVTNSASAPATSSSPAASTVPPTKQATTSSIAYPVLLFFGSAIGATGFWMLVVIFIIQLVMSLSRKFSKNNRPAEAHSSKKLTVMSKIAAILLVAGIIIACVAIVLH